MWRTRPSEPPDTLSELLVICAQTFTFCWVVDSVAGKVTWCARTLNELWQAKLSLTPTMAVHRSSDGPFVNSSSWALLQSCKPLARSLVQSLVHNSPLTRFT